LTREFWFYGGTGKQMRDVMHSEDLLDLIDHQIHNIEVYNNQTLNVGGGLNSSFSLLELSSYCEEITGNKINIKPIQETRTADVRIYVSDCSKLNQVNNGAWYPKKSVKDLVSDTFNWLKANELNLKKILN
jgi:CDP-paratose 2-epimerase